MITFIVCIACIIAGYFVYGKFLEKFFGVDPERATPARTMEDGVDYKPMPTWKIFVIHFFIFEVLGVFLVCILGGS